MKAAVVHAFDEPLAIEDVPAPEPGEGEVRVRLETCGLCHTDIHTAHGDWEAEPTLPLIPGHEGVGIVEAGALAPGTRVAIPWLGFACGDCELCRSGRENLCPRQRNTGYSSDGCFAELATADARFVVEVPQGVDPVDAAPLSCAGLTTYAAIRAAGTRAGDRVAVFGVGGLGHLALQYARIAGAEAVAVDVVPEKLELARELGAAHALHADEAPRAIRKLGGADRAVVVAATPAAAQAAFASLKRGGTMVLVALPRRGVLELPIVPTVLKGITVVGSIVGTRAELRRVLELHAAGETRVVRETRPLEAVNEAMADVEAGRVPGRVVFDLRPAA
ncbi:MAG: alcohol dehydrogenase catalytic domain-containing protein [Pseudomonadota bacterium]